MALPMQARNIATVFISLLMLSGCLYSASNPEGAAKLVKEMHQDMQQQNWDDAMKLYSDEFFKKQSREGWRAHLVSLGQTLGPLKTVHQTFSQKDARYSGDFYVYGFRLHFAKGTAEETITVFRPLDKDALHIIGHIIKPGKAS